MGKKRVLLRAIEAVHLVHKHDGAPAIVTDAFGLGHHLFDFLDACEHRAERDVLGFRAAGDDARQGRLPASRRAPEEHRAQIVAFDLDAERFPRTKEVFLAHEFVERLRTHAVGERPARERFVLRLDCPKQSHCAPFDMVSSKLLPSTN